MKKIGSHIFKLGTLQVGVCITGVGMVNTAFELGKLSQWKYDLVINAGVGGCLADRRVGEVVNVTEDCFSELGAQNDDVFLTVDELGFGTQKVEMIK